jgi:hypothetical protein
MCYDTYSFRFTCANDSQAKAVIYLVKADFRTPQDCFYEGDVVHWETLEYKRKTWGRVAGPMDFCVCASTYDYYVNLAEACKKEFMSTVVEQRSQDLLGGTDSTS